ncbi:MutS-related protein [Costertonia aggregata]|uniref:DNA mismatch repair protein MutS n=1 Tax=Costertonia aggregata TaxID=343403 RepID=A0A7H9AMH2_9FLAO|nr:DNA mismatch repair protein MutS [Costertonia aggregata]QLG44656.1 DNA mismatch repair protein MutS [Costertonia aggregata]
MQDLATFYQNQIQEYSDKLQKLKKQLFVSSMLRLSVFIIAAFVIYLVFEHTKWVFAVIISAIAIFLYLVSRHTNLQYQRDMLKALIQINETEIRVLHRDFDNLPQGNAYKNPLHHFSQDIDLFGRGSFYQYFNRTALKQGSDTLAALLTENTTNDIVSKQEAIKELSDMTQWRHHFKAIASLAKTETTTDATVKWLNAYKPFLPKFMRYLPWIFSILSISGIALYFFDVVPESVLLYWLIFGLLITGVYSKKITRLGLGTSKIQSTFQQYNKLLASIEETNFKSDVLRVQQQKILSDGKKTSLVLKDFSGLLNSIDQNNNLFYLIFGNGFFLRGLATCFKVEQWIKNHGASVEKWFEVIAFFDAYNSLGNFVFNHPEYSFPNIVDDKTILKSKGAGHPLLHPEKSVLNDFQINTEEFFIITGANMAGKSTFLRTVSLQIAMANIGLPVCAKSVDYRPVKLITSMRTTDSLTDDESYFFSELKRLKFVVDEIEKDTYFIVLDEILKGTNSTDKAKGSRKFVERLVASKSTGIIATHDLSLCEVAQELPQVKNHYFDAEIIDDELHFDYRFKDGICQNMNASFLLKKMGIVK